MILYCAERVGLCGMGGGIASQMEIEALASTGYPLTVLCVQKDPHLDASGCIKSHSPVEWIVLSECRAAQPAELSRDYLQSQWRLIQLTRRIRGLKPDLMIVQGTSIHRRLETYRSWDGIPRLMTLHGSPDQFSGMYHDGVDRLPRMRREIAVYDGLVQLGPIMAETWSRQPGLENVPAHVIYNTIDELAAAPVAVMEKAALRAELGVPRDVFALTCVASLQYRKGQDLLLAAMQQLMPHFSHLHLYLVGPAVMGWGGREILRTVDRHAFKDRIHIVGSVPPAKAMRWLKASDCFVLPSREEAMPLSILEAMYLETPVIASDVNGIPDEIEDGVSGLLFSHSRPEGLQEAISRMLEDASFRASCALNARVRYDQQFNQKLYKERWAAIVRNVLR